MKLISALFCGSSRMDEPKREKSSKRRGFSLVELIIFLTVMSVITAAFIPAISRKLQIMTAAVVGSMAGDYEEGGDGSGGEDGGGNDSGSGSLPSSINSQADCNKIASGLLFIPAAKNGEGGKNICVTKFNAGDEYMGGPPLPETVKVVKPGQTCGGSEDFSSKCCWLGNGENVTASDCSAKGNGDSTYSGCFRTVCNWEGANEACASYGPKGTTGKWRLPKRSELLGWQTNGINNVTNSSMAVAGIAKWLGTNGLQFCDKNSDSYGSVKCNDNSGKCKGSRYGNCEITYFWSQDVYPHDTSLVYFFYLDNGNLQGYLQRKKSYAHSVRCVIDSMITKEQEEIEEDTNEYKEEIPYSQKDCDPYNALFIPAEANGAYGKNLCVTKYNAGDTNGLDKGVPTIPLSVKIPLTVTSYKDVCTSNCCWVGNGEYYTARHSSLSSHYNSSENCTDTGNGNSTYSGCKRTVCDYNAAQNICSSWNPDGKTLGKWRLPTQNEVKGWSSYLSTLNTNKGSAGLQLCDNYSSSGVARCGYRLGYYVYYQNSPNSYEYEGYDGKFPCAYYTHSTDGDTTGSCNPANIHVQNGYAGLQNGSFGVNNSIHQGGASVRCVADEVARVVTN